MTHFIYADLTQAEAKQLDAVWNAKNQCYRLPNTIGALRELHTLKPSQDLAMLLKLKEEHRKKWQWLKVTERAMILDKRLRPYQRIDISYLSRLPHAGVFNEQRTGEEI